jgi:hypothetical protein
MKYLLTALAFCTGLFAANAQNTAISTSADQSGKMSAKHPAHNCMMISEKDWAGLGLSDEQTERITAIREECMKTCAAKMKESPKMAMMADPHEDKVKEILTAEQHMGWMKACASLPDAAAPKPMMEMKAE